MSSARRVAIDLSPRRTEATTVSRLRARLASQRAPDGVDQGERGARDHAEANLGVVLEEEADQPTEAERVEAHLRGEQGGAPVVERLELEADGEVARLAREVGDVDPAPLLHR